jgi:glycosyltransferase involved in cell wall biosynthesis
MTPRRYAKPENPEAFIAALKTLKNAPALCEQMGESGYRYAADHYSRVAKARKYLGIIEKVGGLNSSL